MSTVSVQQFKKVSYLWDEKKAAQLAGDEVGLLIYRSNLLGADLRLTNYGGGNTSCKALAKDPVTGKETGLFEMQVGDQQGVLARPEQRTPQMATGTAQTPFFTSERKGNHGVPVPRQSGFGKHETWVGKRFHLELPGNPCF